MYTETVPIYALVALFLFSVWTLYRLAALNRLPAPTVQDVWDGQCICGSHLSGNGHSLGLRLAAWKQKMHKRRKSHRARHLFNLVCQAMQTPPSEQSYDELVRSAHLLDKFGAAIRQIQDKRYRKYVHCRFCDSVHLRAKFPFGESALKICDSGSTSYAHDSWLQHVRHFSMHVFHLLDGTQIRLGEEE